MLISPIFSMHKMAAQSPPDVTSPHSVHIFACVQVDYCTTSILHALMQQLHQIQFLQEVLLPLHTVLCMYLYLYFVCLYSVLVYPSLCFGLSRYPCCCLSLSLCFYPFLCPYLPLVVPSLNLCSSPPTLPLPLPLPSTRSLHLVWSIR